MGKLKIGTLNGKPIVVGDKNIVTDNEIWAKISEDGDLVAIDELVGESPTPTIDKEIIAVFYNGTSPSGPSPAINLGTGELVYCINGQSLGMDPVSSISKENNTSYVEIHDAWALGGTAKVHFQIGTWLNNIKAPNSIVTKYGVALCDKNQYKTVEVETQRIDVFELMREGIGHPTEARELANGVIVLEFYNSSDGIIPDPTPFYTYRLYLGDDA